MVGSLLVPAGASAVIVNADAQLLGRGTSGGKRVNGFIPTRLDVTVTSGASIKMKCGKGICKTRTLRPKRRTTDLKRYLRSFLPAGSAISLRITKPGEVGIAITYRIGRGTFKRSQRLLEQGTTPSVFDQDGDGFQDGQDRCPTVPGTLEGCPGSQETDTDGDGVPDSSDACPSAPAATANGCQPAPGDSDGDGVNDSEDKCPSQAGTAANQGCTSAAGDRDGDGVLDSNDACPTEAGRGSSNGCPPPANRDGDGYPDSTDSCPDQVGSAPDGCNKRPTGSNVSYTLNDNVLHRRCLYNAPPNGGGVKDPDGTLVSWSMISQSFGTTSWNFVWEGNGCFQIRSGEMSKTTTVSFTYKTTDNQGAVSDQLLVTMTFPP